MAIYRNVQLSFWTDSKVVDDFTPEDKYFYLYLLTNPHTNLIGCYEVSLKQMSDETGYNKDTIERLLNRMAEIHNVIRYNKQTKEVYLLNWGKHNWTKSEKLDKPLLSQISNVKDIYFRQELTELFNSRKDTVTIPYPYPMDTTVTVTVTDTNTVTDSNSNNKEIISNIINYLNNKLGTNYRANTKGTVKHINARLNEGYLEEDFYLVIDKKYESWGNDPKMSQYLTPDTLFGTKFEKYYNEKPVVKKTQVDEWAEILNGKVE